VQRFFNEARSVNAIKHPHIVEIIDFVHDLNSQDGAYVYMVMEHLEGEDARTRLLNGGPYNPELLISVASQAAKTLAAAHEAGFLHRDLKPDNIFLCRTADRDDYVKLLDFGAAKAFGDRPGHNLTRPGVAIGTPEYMSPEQILGRPLDGRVDCYGLGVVCYELLTGARPFVADKVAELLAMHTRDPPPSIAQMRHVEPPAPPALEQAILRCMAKAPEDRYPDLWAAAQAFEAALPGTSNVGVKLGPELDGRANHAASPRGRSRLASKRWPLIITVAVAAATILFLTLALLS
jgi:serine/threonine-protein kinase